MSFGGPMAFPESSTRRFIACFAQGTKLPGSASVLRQYHYYVAIANGKSGRMAVISQAGFWLSRNV